jgi:UDP-N-acetylglucosamine:LPS N-acetylglucosamine transferase
VASGISSVFGELQNGFKKTCPVIYSLPCEILKTGEEQDCLESLLFRHPNPKRNPSGSGLKQLEIDATVYFGLSLRSVKKKLRGSHVTVADVPFVLGKDMPRKSVAVHRGGLGFTAAALMAGVPQVMLFENDETQFNAESIVKAGAGLAVFINKITSDTFVGAIEHVSTSPAMRENALKLANEHAQFRS